MSSRACPGSLANCSPGFDFFSGFMGACLSQGNCCCCRDESECHDSKLDLGLAELRDHMSAADTMLPLLLEMVVALLLESRRGRLYVCIGRNSPAAPPVGTASIVKGAWRLRRAGLAAVAEGLHIGIGVGGIDALALDLSVRMMNSCVLDEATLFRYRSCGAAGWKAGYAGPETAVEPIVGGRSRAGTFRGNSSSWNGRRRTTAASEKDR